MNSDAGELKAIPGSDTAASLPQLATRIAGRLRLGLYHQSTRYGLRRDLHVPIQRPSAKIPIDVRPMIDSDLESLLPTGEGDHAEKLDVARRRAFVERCPQGCFVAIDQRDGAPCYMQWLIGAADNPFIRRMGGFPQLQEQEALLENAYTPAKYRGLGIMSAAMALIAERGHDLGADYVLTFVDQHNIASLKGCQRAGFFPHLLHQKAQIGFGIFARDTFETLAEGDPRRTMTFDAPPRA